MGCCNSNINTKEEELLLFEEKIIYCHNSQIYFYNITSNKTYKNEISKIYNSEKCVDQYKQDDNYIRIIPFGKGFICISYLYLYYEEYDHSHYARIKILNEYNKCLYRKDYIFYKVLIINVIILIQI